MSSYNVSKILIIVAMCFFFAPLEAFQNSEEKNISAALIDIQKDLLAETDKLNAIRESILQEKLPLAQGMNELEQELIQLREEKHKLSISDEVKERNIESLKKEMNFLEEELKFSQSSLNDFVHKLKENVFPFEELAVYLSKQKKGLAINKFNDLVELLSFRHRNFIGGCFLEGMCLDEKGIRHKGVFSLVGPFSYFLSFDQKMTGLVHGLGRKGFPRIVFSGFDLSKLFQGKMAPIPIDPSVGNALKIKGTKKTILEIVKAGGITMFPILGLGVLCLIIVFWKFISLNQLACKEDSNLKEIIHLLRSKEMNEALQKVERLKAPLGPVLREGIIYNDSHKDNLQEIMEEKILFQIPSLETGLNILAVSAAASPLLGLLGTVTGMIHTFNLVTVFGTGKAHLLSSGISEALITTEFGLIVAIPALLAHAYLSRRVKVIIQNLEQMTLSFINSLHLRRACEK